MADNFSDITAENGASGGKKNHAVKGDILRVVLVAENWDAPGEYQQLDCGSFEIHEVSFSDPPPEVSIKATSVPLTKTVRAQKKTKAWERIKLSAMAAKIASDAGMGSLYEAKDNPFFDRISQHQTADLAFLGSVCRDEGFTLKVTNSQIVVFSEQEYEEREPSITFTRGDARIISISFSQNTGGTAKSATSRYKDPKSGKLVEEQFEPEEAPETEVELIINDRPSDLSGDIIRETTEGDG